MKAILAALFLATAAVPVTMTPATAASVTFSTNGGDDVVIQRDHRRNHDRDSWRQSDHRRDWRRHHQRDCRTKVVKSWHNHRRVIREVTVCD